MNAHIVPEAIGTLAFAAGMYALWQKDDRKLMFIFSAISAVWAANFLLIGAYTASGVSLFTAIRMHVARIIKSRWLSVFFITGYLPDFLVHCPTFDRYSSLSLIDPRCHCDVSFQRKPNAHDNGVRNGAMGSSQLPCRISHRHDL